MEPGVVIAFLAGVMSFLSPCVLALAPGYIAFVAGIGARGLEEAAGAGPGRRSGLLLATFLFVLGFSSVFMVIGVGASLVGGLFLSLKGILERIAGAVILVFGLHIGGALRLAPLYREKRFLDVRMPAGRSGSFAVGAAFALGWTPCIGPILGSILAIAGVSGSLRRGLALLTAYSVGLGIPFIAMGAAISYGVTSFPRLFRHSRIIELASGLCLAALGLLMLSGRMGAASGWIMRMLGDFVPDRLLGM